MMDIHTKAWSEQALQVVAGGDEQGKELAEKLGHSIVPAHSVVGRIASYFIHRQVSHFLSTTCTQMVYKETG